MLVLCSQSSSAKKKKKITGGARLQLIYIYSLATTAWPGLRMALAVSETSRKHQSGAVRHRSEGQKIQGHQRKYYSRNNLLHRDPRRLISQRRQPRRVVLDLRRSDDVPKLPPPEPRLQEVRLDARALPLIRR